MSDLITAAETLRAIEWAVEQRSADHVEKECAYHDEAGFPACVVGAAVAYAHADFALFEGEVASAPFKGYATDNAIETAGCAQNLQGTSVSREDALTRGKQRFAKLEGEV